MTLRLLKILATITFLAITYEGEVLGGPYGVFLLLGFGAGFLPAILSLLILAILLLFLYSAIRPFKPIDLIIFMAGGVILFIPVIVHTNSIVREMAYRRGGFFLVTLIPFVLFYSLTLFMVIRQNIKMGSSA